VKLLLIDIRRQAESKKQKREDRNTLLEEKKRKGFANIFSPSSSGQRRFFSLPFSNNQHRQLLRPFPKSIASYSVIQSN